MEEVKVNIDRRFDEAFEGDFNHFIKLAFMKAAKVDLDAQIAAVGLLTGSPSRKPRFELDREAVMKALWERSPEAFLSFTKVEMVREIAFRGINYLAPQQRVLPPPRAPDPLFDKLLSPEKMAAIVVDERAWIAVRPFTRGFEAENLDPFAHLVMVEPPGTELLKEIRRALEMEVEPDSWAAKVATGFVRLQVLLADELVARVRSGVIPDFWIEYVETGGSSPVQMDEHGGPLPTLVPVVRRAPQ